MWPLHVNEVSDRDSHFKAKFLDQGIMQSPGLSGGAKPDVKPFPDRLQFPTHNQEGNGKNQGD